MNPVIFWDFAQPAFDTFLLAQERRSTGETRYQNQNMDVFKVIQSFKMCLVCLTVYLSVSLNYSIYQLHTCFYIHKHVKRCCVHYSCYI